MSIDVQAFIAVVIGLVCAALYVFVNKKHLVYLVCAWQLVTDNKYTKHLIDSIGTHNFALSSSYTYRLMPPEEHTAAFAASKSTLLTGISSEYIVVARAMIFQLLRISILPFVASILLGDPFVFMGAVVIGISALVVYETLFNHGKNYVHRMQINLLLRHVYASSKLATTRLDNSSMNETIQRDTLHNLGNKPTTESNGENDSRQEYAAYGSIDSSSAKQQQFTWQRVWWVNDALLCTLLIILYWFAIGSSVQGSIYGSIQIILFVQIFFVPVWFVITIAQKLLSN